MTMIPCSPRRSHSLQCNDCLDYKHLVHSIRIKVFPRNSLGRNKYRANFSSIRGLCWRRHCCHAAGRGKGAAKSQLEAICPTFQPRGKIR